MSHYHKERIKETIDMAAANVQAGIGGPFAALIVKDGRVVGRGVNRVTTVKDPTAHAEIMAIRDACKTLDTYKLDGAVIYSSCEPCPMCLSAIYWARLDAIYYGAGHADAARAGFDDSFIYEQVRLSPRERSVRAERIDCPHAFKPFQDWIETDGKIEY
jgi:guanine deaminase